MVVRVAERRIAVPTGMAFRALGEVLDAIAKGEGPWAGFFFHVDLGHVNLPNVGYIAIPIQLTIGKHTPGINQYRINIRAASHPTLFPVFDGQIGTDASGDETVIWIGGSYDVPFGTAGAVFDAGVARGIAQRCVENFNEDVANAVQAMVEQRESDA